MDTAVKNMMFGVILFVVAIIMLVAIILPQMHTGYTYVNTTITEASYLSNIWPILELLVTIAFFFSGLGLLTAGVVQKIRGGGGGGRRKRK